MKHRICLFGRNYSQVFVIKLLSKMKFPKPIIIVDKLKTYARDKSTLSKFKFYADLEKMSKNVVEIIYINKINSKKTLDILKKRKITLGLSIGCRSIFKEKIINYFQGNLFNIHDGLLPKERGGGLNTWRILLGTKSIGSTLHKIEKGIDSGKILYQQSISIKKKKDLYPIDIMKLLHEVEKKIILKFFKNLSNLNFLRKLKVQNNDRSEYFARLYSKVNGALDVDQSPKTFERNVRAFSDPYEGGWIELNKKKIFFKKVKIIKDKDQRFDNKIFNGRIIRKQKNGEVIIIIGGGLIAVKSVFVNGLEIKAFKFFKLNTCIRNSQKTLDKARNFIPNITKIK